MPFQPMNFSNIAPLKSPIADLVQTLAQGYKAGQLPSIMARQEEKENLANQAANLNLQALPGQLDRRQRREELANQLQQLMLKNAPRNQELQNQIKEQQLRQAQQNYEKSQLETDPNKKFDYNRQLVDNLRDYLRGQTQVPMKPVDLSPKEQKDALMKALNLGNPSQKRLLGSAGEALDMYQLQNNPDIPDNVKQLATQIQASKDRNRDARTELTANRAEGLKSGERWLYDDKGEKIGKESPLTVAQKDEISGRAFFNEVFPVFNDAQSYYSGQGSIGKLINDVKKYNSDPTSQQRVDDFLLSIKLLAPLTTKESSTIRTGKQKNVIESLQKSLKSSDIPASVEKIAVKYGLPSDAVRKAGQRFSDIVNAATEKGEKSVPAYMQTFFNPEEQVGKYKKLYSPENKVAISGQSNVEIPQDIQNMSDDELRKLAGVQ